MHKIADEVQAAIDIPLLHLADATAKRIVDAKLSTVGLLGTNFTMEQDFYKGRLEHHGITVVTPDKIDRDIVHGIIYEELCLGEVKDESRNQYLTIIDKLASGGAAAVIEGCTEITLLVKQHHTRVPLFDTTAIHAEEAVHLACQ